MELQKVVRSYVSSLVFGLAVCVILTGYYSTGFTGEIQRALGGTDSNGQVLDGSHPGQRQNLCPQRRWTVGLRRC